MTTVSSPSSVQTTSTAPSRPRRHASMGPEAHSSMDWGQKARFHGF